MQRIFTAAVAAAVVALPTLTAGGPAAAGRSLAASVPIATGGFAGGGPIAAGGLAADRLAAGTLAAGGLAADRLAAGTLAAGGLAADRLAAGTLAAGGPAAGGPAVGPKPVPPPSGSGSAPTTGADALRNPSRGYVDGVDDQRDDWGDEATLSNHGSYWRSNYAALWQTILWADGHMNEADIDCEFGPQTEANTRAWQATYGLPQTGKADTASRTFADNFINSDPLGPEYFRYLGTGGRYIQFHRYGGGVSNPYRYDVNFFGEWRGSWYNSVSLSRC
ncbi:peptidoglycan-binding protein [Couchioplanes caeruleus subsp. azureus]|uniref:peptidoglycan-binding domain-containing protein n=1 Tax=Couchioplanes caeruleus TaxID=56438 RepID=UPI00360D36A1